MTDHIIVIPKDETAALMAAVADLEERANHAPNMEKEERDAIETISRLVRGERKVHREPHRPSIIAGQRGDTKT